MRRPDYKQFSRMIRSLEDDTEDRYLAAALGKVYGFSEPEARELLRLSLEVDDHRVISTLKKVLFDIDSAYPKTLRRFREELQCYESVAASAASSPLVQRVREREIDDDSLEQALLDVHAPIDPDSETPVGSISWGLAKRDLSSVVDLWDDIGVAHLKEVTDYLEHLFSDAGPEMTTTFVKAFVEEIRRAEIALIFETPESKQFSLMERTVARALFECGSAIPPLLQNVDRYRPSYVELNDRHKLVIFQTLPLTVYRDSFSVCYTAERTRAVEEAGIDLKHLVELVRAAPSEVSYELLDLCAQRPQVIVPHITLKRHGITPRQYVDFLLTTHDEPWISDGHPKTFGDTVAEFSQGSRARAASFIVEHGAELVGIPDAKAVADILRDYTEASILLGDYLGAVRANQQQRGQLLLKIGQAAPDAPLLKNLRTLLRTTPESGVADILQGYEGADRTLDPKGLERRLGKCRSSASVSERTIPREYIPWQDLASQTLEGVPRTRDVFQRAFDQLEPQDQHQLRNIWRTERASLETFCDHVDRFYPAPSYRLVLGSHTLFTAYKSRLRMQDPRLTDALTAVCSAEISNPFPLLYQALCPEVAEEELPSATLLSEQDHKARQKIRCSRLLVWGGQYKTEARSRIESAIPGLPVVIMDDYNRRREIKIIRDGDGVITVTTSISHPLYTAVKQHCKTNGIPYADHHQSGVDSLLAMITTSVEKA
ncbi:hypothetical protein HYW21_00070 [Candidatus Woesearchaeota archaeon]|nr:hypothetical protein [Candidatus Woesearchaeota archaeon]